MTTILSSIKTEWLANKGRGVSVGVCDSGIDPGRAELASNIREYRKYGDTARQIHGNHICGIIFGTSNKSGAIRALSPLSDAFVADVNLQVGNPLDNLRDALAWLGGFRLDVLNLSLAYDEDNHEIRDILNKISCGGTWVFSAFSERRRFPWSYRFISSVGCKFDHRVDFVAANKCRSLGTSDRNSLIEGSSVSCALTSAAACLYRGFNKDGTLDDFKKEVNGADLYVQEINQDGKTKYFVMGV